MLLFVLEALYYSPPLARAEMEPQMTEELRNQLTKLSIQQIRIGAVLDKLEISNLRTYAKEEALNYATLLKCRTMYRLARSVKAAITDERFEEPPELGAPQDNEVIDLYPHLR
jgi:hypothetical protein